MAGDNGYVTLMGAEQVQSAANTMRTAADTIQNAAGNIQYALERHERFMESWLLEFEKIVERLAKNASST